MFNIDLYKLPSGKTPVRDFFDTLNPYEMDEVDTILSLLEEHGNKLKMPHSRFLRDGIYELRIPTDEKNIRILYFFTAGKIIILTNAFCKKQQETPKSAIELAIKYKKDYLKGLKR